MFMSTVRNIVSKSRGLLYQISWRFSPGIYWRSCNACGSLEFDLFRRPSNINVKKSIFFPSRLYGDHRLTNFYLTRLLRLQYVLCKECGLAYINPLPLFSDIDKSTFDGERNIIAWKDHDWQYYVNDKINTMKAYYDHVGLEKVRRLNRMLDVSCGPGVALNWFKNEKGWLVNGIDPDLHSARVAKSKFDIDIQSGLISDLRASEESFDFVIMDNSLEHYFDPLAAMLRVYRLLRSGGLFCIIVPNAAGLSTLFADENLYWGHWFMFTPLSLWNMLSAVGYQFYGLIANQEGRIPDRLAGMKHDFTKYKTGLSSSFFGSNKAVELERGAFYSDYFSIIVQKPETTLVRPAEENLLNLIARRSRKELSWWKLPRVSRRAVSKISDLMHRTSKGI